MEQTFVVLEYDKGSKKFDDPLMGSQLAVDSAARGAELQPDWAKGAKIFAEGISIEHFQGFALCNRHVVIRPEDEETLQAMLFQLTHRDRPKRKPRDGRTTVDGGSFSASISLSSSSSSNLVDVPHTAF